MAWITTDTDVACTLDVYKTVNGQNIPGYPKQYSLLDPFGDFTAITVNDWHKLTELPRSSRIEAFKTHVSKLEVIDVDSTQINNVFRQSTETPGLVVE